MTVYVKTNNGGTLNLRSAPNGTNVLTKIPNGTAIEAPNGLGDEWTQVQYNSYTGYVMTKYLSTATSTITKTDIQKIYDSLQQTLKVIEGVLK